MIIKSEDQDYDVHLNVPNLKILMGVSGCALSNIIVLSIDNNITGSLNNQYWIHKYWP